ncbi:hypothetical protein TRIUR3_02266 [Triticum urartu]|uniref:Uncharacterized protein n=1 Tax=Triticum urartu TaxID=4572 RepID=M8ACB7_TRIUA|nr:hypothetical protein TRIUR3_02266 [Triticum urartu]
MLQYKVLIHIEEIRDFGEFMEPPWTVSVSSDSGQSGLPSPDGGGSAMAGEARPSVPTGSSAPGISAVVSPPVPLGVAVVWGSPRLAAAAAIDKLPELDAAAFPNHPASASANKQSSALHAEADGSQLQQQQLTRSGCSSTSETSKGSVLSLSRSDSRVKARERARDRSASVKDKDDSVTAAVRRRAPSAQAASFTELLTGLAAATPAVAHHKQHNSWQQMTASATADYLGFSQPRKSGHGMLHTFASPAPHLGNIAPVAMSPAQHFSLSAGGGDSQTDMPHFSFSQDHYMPVHAAPASAPAVDYSLNFSMCSGLVGVNNTRGTLQSNSQPHLSGHHHHQQQLQRLSTPLDAPHIPFLFSPAVAVASPTTAESHFGAAAALQLWEGVRHSDMKEKGKN